MTMPCNGCSNLSCNQSEYLEQCSWLTMDLGPRSRRSDACSNTVVVDSGMHRASCRRMRMAGSGILEALNHSITVLGAAAYM